MPFLKMYSNTIRFISVLFCVGGMEKMEFKHFLRSFLFSLQIQFEYFTGNGDWEDGWDGVGKKIHTHDSIFNMLSCLHSACF